MWKDVEGFGGRYQVSDDGRVRSTAQGVWKEMKTMDDRGYKKVSLRDPLTRRSTIVGVHRLVALAFIPNPDGLPEVNHIDEDKGNNRVDNLEWCSRSQNMRHAALPDRISIILSKRVARIDLETGIVLELFRGTREAQRDGWDSGGVSRCCTGAASSYKGFGWRYVEDDVKAGDCIVGWNHASKRNENKPVLQIDKRSGEVVERFESAKAAQRSNAKFVASNVTAACKGRLKSCAGYRWEYE